MLSAWASTSTYDPNVSFPLNEWNRSLSGIPPSPHTHPFHRTARWCSPPVTTTLFSSPLNGTGSLNQHHPPPPPFSQDGSLVLTAGDDDVVLVHDRSTGALRKEMRGHHNSIYAATFCPCARPHPALGAT